jgi:Tfp pilus assembly protein PilV
MSPLRNRFISCRAFTLIEALVSVALLTVVCGILMGIFISTRANCEKSQNQLSMQSQAALTANQVNGVLSSAVKPSALDVATSATLVFAADKCSLLSNKNSDWKKPVLCSIFNEANNEFNQVACETSGTPKHHLGLKIQSRFETKVNFQYASVVEVPKDDAAAAFKTTLPTGEYPRLIRATITVEDTRKEFKPYVLTESVRLP